MALVLIEFSGVSLHGGVKKTTENISTKKISKSLKKSRAVGRRTAAQELSFFLSRFNGGYAPYRFFSSSGTGTGNRKKHKPTR
jgi:hypothetical protein